MGSFLYLFWHLIRALFLPKERLAAEVVVLRQQVIVLKRKAPKRLHITETDRRILSWICRLQTVALSAIIIVKPETVARWHRAGFRMHWAWKSRKRAGRPKADTEIRDLIRQMCSENPLWGAPRIHGELLMLGFDISQSTVSKYMIRRRGPPSLTWRTFLKHQADGIAAIDLFTVPTVRFEVVYALVILAHGSRQIVHFATTRNPNAEWVARQIVEAFPWDTSPNYLLRDNDAIYGHVYRERLANLNIREVRTACRSPWQNAYAERLIGSVRRECLDHSIVWNRRYLQQTLKSYAEYYNSDRTHLGLLKKTPSGREPAKSDEKIIAFPSLNGLHHRYDRVAA